MIHVLFGHTPGMIPESVRELIAAQPDMRIVGDAESPIQILHEVGARQVQVVVLSTADAEEPGLCSHLLAAFPDVVILSIAIDLSSAFLQHRRPQRHAVPDTELDTILSSLRLLLVE